MLQAPWLDGSERSERYETSADRAAGAVGSDSCAMKEGLTESTHSVGGGVTLTDSSRRVCGRRRHRARVEQAYKVIIDVLHGEIAYSEPGLAWASPLTRCARTGLPFGYDDSAPVEHFLQLLQVEVTLSGAGIGPSRNYCLFHRQLDDQGLYMRTSRQSKSEQEQTRQELHGED